jgi:chitinase
MDVTRSTVQSVLAGSQLSCTIGYYEGWGSTRSCDARMPDDLDVTALTHVNFAFAYFDPTTFEVTPMSNSDIPLFTNFTGLKARKPSMQTWIAIGGWAFNDPGNSPDRDPDGLSCLSVYPSNLTPHQGYSGVLDENRS